MTECKSTAHFPKNNLHLCYSICLDSGPDVCKQKLYSIYYTVGSASAVTGKIFMQRFSLFLVQCRQVRRLRLRYAAARMQNLNGVMLQYAAARIRNLNGPRLRYAAARIRNLNGPRLRYAAARIRKLNIWYLCLG